MNNNYVHPLEINWFGFVAVTVDSLNLHLEPEIECFACRNRSWPFGTFCIIFPIYILISSIASILKMATKLNSISNDCRNEDCIQLPNVSCNNVNSSHINNIQCKKQKAIVSPTKCKKKISAKWKIFPVPFFILIIERWSVF